MSTTTNGDQEPLTTSASEPELPPQSSSASETKPQRLTETQKAEKVSELLFGDREDNEDEGDPTSRDLLGTARDDADEEGGDGPARLKPPSSLDELRDSLGLDDEALYKIKLNTGDGEAVTLGDLKDAYQDRSKAARETVKREAALDAREAALVADQQLWQEIGNQLGAAVKPETLNALKLRTQQHAAKEQQALFNAIPELRDEAVFKNWRGDLVKFLHEGYGFKPQEMVITDHRILLVLRDFMRTKSRLDKLLSFEPSQNPPSSKRSKPPITGAAKRSQLLSRARNGNDSQKVAAVSALLNGR
ncbi:MAG: hypothetical protein QM699_06855 [Amaricoccus sp.]|uniref:hypothetical protein n=1 Tax=Amaricoccus sp. TaxID=1872485 RepID=UPI0039E2BA2B